MFYIGHKRLGYSVAGINDLRSISHLHSAVKPEYLQNTLN